MNGRSVLILGLLPLALSAQVLRDPVPLKPWAAPLYWQPGPSESRIHSPQLDAASTSVNPEATSPVGSLVFVGMTPCRVVDTRSDSGFTGAFGPPSLLNAIRTFPIRSSTTCSIPAVAQAYSFNVTVVPPGFLGYITIYPTGQLQPLASTLNDYLGTIVANAAIVPAGTNGSVDVYANNPTDLIIDINGYYAPQTGVTLAQGSAAAPSLSFSSDAGTGIFSSAASTVNISTGGTNRLTVSSNGDVDIPGSLRKNGTLFLHNLGNGNTALGLTALGSASGTFNTADGYQALFSNTTGNFNSALGSAAMYSNTTGNYNTGNGYNALYSNSSGSYNVAIGYLSLGSASAVGDGNVAVGNQALYLNGTGATNTAVGFQALQNNATGSSNIGIGYNAGFNVSLGSNNIFIGNQGVVSDNNTIRIGGFPAVPTSFYVAGVRGITTGQANAVDVMIDSNGQLGTVSSSRRFKEDIHDMGDASSGLLKLRPVTFRYKQPYNDGSKPLDYGLIAEEVAAVYPELAVKGADGQIETVQYQKLNTMLLNEVQKQHQRIEEQQDELAALKTRLADLEKLLTAGK